MKRSDAATLGLTIYTTNNPCLHGHPPKRYTSNGICVQCSLESGRRQRQKLANKIKTVKSSIAKLDVPIHQLHAVLSFLTQLDAAEQSDKVMITRAVRTAQFAQITEILDAFD